MIKQSYSEVTPLMLLFPKKVHKWM